MSENFEKIMLQEFKKINNKLENIDIKISNLEQNVTELKQDVSRLNERMDRLEEKMDRLEERMDISNTNMASMLERQNNLSEQMKTEHKELLLKIEDNEKQNELEHSKLNYEICKLKARA